TSGAIQLVLLEEHPLYSHGLFGEGGHRSPFPAMDERLFAKALSLRSQSCPVTGGLRILGGQPAMWGLRSDIGDEYQLEATLHSAGEPWATGNGMKTASSTAGTLCAWA
ncbi:MAG TPA: hypothetical protein DCM14_06895, partial [Clostridiales bacterium UBA8153]|nr:hypothetical protein [Clostridiales bacterium UBA8153]